MTIFNRLASTVEKLTPEKAIEFLDRIKFVKPEDFGKGKTKWQDVVNAIEDTDVRLAFPTESSKDVKTILDNIPKDGILNKATGIRGYINVNQKGKLLSSEALNKSLANGFSREQHLEAIANIKSLFENAVLLAKQDNKKSDDGSVSIYRFASPFVVDEGNETSIADALITAKETRGLKGQRIYTLELTEIIKPLGEVVANKETDYHPSGINNLAQKHEKVKRFLEKNPNFLGQSNKNGEKYRGGYLPPSVDEFLSKKHEITLFEHADASTVIHEIAHYTFKTLEYFVNAGLADTQLVEDFAKLKEWAEKQGGDFHENLAKGFEAYIMEGVAPVSSLTSIFATMARMMKQIYKDVKNLGVALSDDVRQIFDSYLTSADEVERDSALVKVANAINLGLLGLNQKEAKEFTKLINSAKEQQIAELTKEKNKQLKVQRKLWKKEADELISQDRVLNARRAIEKEGKLDYSAVKDLAGAYIADKLKDMVGVAELYHAVTK